MGLLGGVMSYSSFSFVSGLGMLSVLHFLGSLMCFACLPPPGFLVNQATKCSRMINTENCGVIQELSMLFYTSSHILVASIALKCITWLTVISFSHIFRMKQFPFPKGGGLMLYFC